MWGALLQLPSSPVQDALDLVLNTDHGEARHSVPAALLQLAAAVHERQVSRHALLTFPI